MKTKKIFYLSNLNFNVFLLAVILMKSAQDTAVTTEEINRRF
jgi:hypothetical protein